MTPSEIQEAYERANEVINGFKRPSARIAKDVVNLVRHISEAAAKKQATGTYTNSMPDFLKDLFK